MNLSRFVDRKQLLLVRWREMFHASFPVGPEAAHPIDYEDQDWPAELWSRGCFSVSMPPGVMTTLGRVIREPHG
jgi:monoamine oxidase